MRAPVAAEWLRALLAVVWTLPFGVASGALYPALAALHGRGAGRATAVSGAGSSLGAAVAVLLVTFGLAPAFGVRGSLAACAGLYLVALALAGTLGREQEDGGERAGDPRAVTGASTSKRAASDRSSKNGSRKKARARAAMPPGSASTVVLAASPVGAQTAALALVGFASIVWQLAMSRLGVLAFGPSAFALAAATAAHTAALGVGEAAAAAQVERVERPGRALAWVLAAAGALAVGATALAPRLPAWSAARFAAGTPSMASLWAGAFGMLAALMLPVIGLVGTAIPLGARWLADRGEDPARANGRVLGAMAVGNVLGALLGPLALVPRLALPGALLAAAGTLVLAAAAAAGRSAWRGRAGLLGIGFVALMAVGGWRAARGWDPTALSRGPFLYARAEDLDLGTVVRFGYGREATVAVRRDEAGTVLLQIDGKVDATSGGDAATQVLVGVVPTVLCEHPREVLVVGLGSGMTVDAVRDVPGVVRVDVTELLPEVVDAARGEFRVANHDVLASPRVRLLRQDASLYLRGTSARYDVIVSEPSNPWVVGMADLFTVEVLRAARARLTPGGVMAAWLHAYSTDAATFVSVLETFRAVFPRAALLELVPGQDYMVVGVTDPPGVDVDRVARDLAHPALAAQLERAGVVERGALFGRFVAGPDGLRAIAREGEVLRADDLRLEFRAPMLLYEDAAQPVFALLARAQDLPLAGLAPRGAAYDAVIEESEPLREAALHARQMALARAARDLDGAIHEGELAVAAAPRDPALRTALAQLYIRRAGRRYRRRDPGGAEDDMRSALELRPGPAEQFRARVVLGDMALAREAFGPAAREYGAALEIARLAQAPAPELHVRMAQVLRALGDVPHARAELDRAIRECVDPARLAEILTLRNALGEGAR
jgi:spermidine synthase